MSGDIACVKTMFIYIICVLYGCIVTLHACGKRMEHAFSF